MCSRGPRPCQRTPLISFFSAFASAWGDSQIPALWPVSALSMDFQGNLACGGKGLSQIGGYPFASGILLLATETLNQYPGTALCRWMSSGRIFSKR